jgi:hypothetical protein
VDVDELCGVEEGELWVTSKHGQSGIVQWLVERDIVPSEDELTTR